MRRQAVLILGVLAMVALVVLSRHYHPEKVMVWVGIFVPVLMLLLALFPRRPDAPTAGRLDLALVTEDLAIAVGRQWQAEAQVRSLNDPYPLPVRWGPADAGLGQRWSVLETLASTGAGWPVPQEPGVWAAGPDELAGGGGLVEVLTRVPTGRLVVLGQPGAGKTMLLVRLVLDLLARRTPGQPVPMLVPVASWNPAEQQDLYRWLAERITVDHSGLAELVPSLVGGEPVSLARALLERGLILPVLDGLDEIPEPVRGAAVAGINAALRSGQPVLLSCRTADYQAAVRPPGGVEVTLTGAAVVEVCPLDGETVARYLLDSAGGTAGQDRWSTVVQELRRPSTTGTLAPLVAALTTPLMATLARVVYNPQPGEAASALPEPSELSSFATRAEVERHLFDGFIPAAYRPHRRHRCRWTARDAERWIVWLAVHLQSNLHGTPDLAWWQLPFSHRRAVASGLALGLAVGLVFGLAVRIVDWLAYGLALAFWLAVGLAVGVGLQRQRAPARGLHWSAIGLTSGLTSGLVFGIGGVLAIGIRGGLAIGLACAGIGLVFGLPFGLGFGLTGAPADITSAASPAAILARDRRSFGLLISARMLAFGLMFGLVNGLAFGLMFGLMNGVVFGLAAGIGGGLGGELAVQLHSERGEAAWGRYVLARVGWAMTGRLPWRFMGFLADAHEHHGVLRQVGAVYQFRHLDLQRRLADWDR
jgi:hypothetical protein